MTDKERDKELLVKVQNLRQKAFQLLTNSELELLINYYCRTTLKEGRDLGNYTVVLQLERVYRLLSIQVRNNATSPHL